MTREEFIALMEWIVLNDPLTNALVSVLEKTPSAQWERALTEFQKEYHHPKK